jgi:hypothetical protein
VYDAIFIEERGKPSVSFVFQYFANDARSGGSSHGMSQIRIVPENIVSECTVMEEIEPEIARVIEKVIEGLTAPLTAEEKFPQSHGSETPQKIVFQGDLAEVNKFFYKRGWTDGLPIIPPTEEAVSEMLQGTDLSPDYLVAKLEPRLGKATVEKIAINGVMAGALPTHMPALIAGTRALVSNPTAVMMAVSTGSFTPMWILNGPIRNDIRINSSFGASSPGDIANAAIGRAMSLITKNIRGVRKQIEDMGVLGNPGKYTWVIGENEENSPWEPLHVERGLRREDSAITLTFPQTYHQFLPFETTDQGLLKSICFNVTPAHLGVFGVLLTPNNARTLAKRGWDKQSIKKYLLENTRMPLERHQRYYMVTAAERAALNPQEMVSVFQFSSMESDSIQIYVVGGFGSWMGIANGGKIATEKIDLPANWNKLAAKYKDFTPNYLMY